MVQAFNLFGCSGQIVGVEIDLDEFCAKMAIFQVLGVIRGVTVA